MTKPESIAVIIKTTPERFSLKWLLLSIEHALSKHKHRLYIADENPLPEWKQQLYDELIAKGHHVKVWDQPVAVTVARNDLVNSLRDEAFVLRVDDDFELGGEFNIDAILTVLEQDDIDFCCDVERQIGKGKGRDSGSLRVDSSLILFRANRPPKIKRIVDGAWRFEKADGVRFARADYMRNLILLKRHCFENVKWNEKLIFSGEHADFYLALKKAGFQGAFTPDSIHLHRDDLKHTVIDKEEDEKMKRLQRENNKKDVFTECWGGLPETRSNLFSAVSNKLKRLLLYTK